VFREFELHVAEPEDIIKRWGEEHPDYIKNTREIADRCHVELELGKILIPKFPVPKGEDEKSYLHKLVWRGLAWRYGGKSEADVASLSEAAAKKTLTKEIIEILTAC